MQNLYFALPEIIVFTTIVIALLADLFFNKLYANISFFVVILGLFLALGVCLQDFSLDAKFALHNFFINDGLSQLSKIFILLTVIIGFLYSKAYIEVHKINLCDYYVLGTSATLGMMLLVSAQSFLIIYLAIELLSLPLYTMTAMRRFDNLSSEAALKYFMMGAVASALLLFGISLVYAATGGLNFGIIARAIHVNPAQYSPILSYALVLILAGLGFKLAVAPFHMWAPDVYQGAPTAVTLLIGSAPKVAVMAAILRILDIVFPDLIIYWQPMIGLFAVISLMIGNVVAVMQTNIKRLLSYSAIAHMGYAALGIYTGSDYGYNAAIYYTLIYSVMSIAGFGFLILSSKSGFEIETLEDLKGFNSHSPWHAAMLLVVLLSMAGIPPTVGFVAKLMIFKALIATDHIELAIFGLLFAVIGAYYYLRIIKFMYFDTVVSSSTPKVSISTAAIYSINSLALLILGILPNILLTICSKIF